MIDLPAWPAKPAYAIGRWTAVVTSVGLAMLLSSCFFGYESVPDYHYRLTLQVDTPEGPRSGSSVISVSTAQSDHDSITPDAMGASAKGQAASVDLPNGFTLYALMAPPTSEDWAQWIMVWLTPKHAARRLKEFYPDMVADHRIHILRARFRPSYGDGTPSMQVPRPYLLKMKGADWRTAELVDPDKLADSFGTGYGLKSISVQMTNDNITYDIRKKLPWLSESPEPAVPTEFEYNKAKVLILHGFFYRSDDRD